MPTPQTRAAQPAGTDADPHSAEPADPAHTQPRAEVPRRPLPDEDVGADAPGEPSIRRRRPFGVTLELGVNNVAGSGLALSYSLKDHLSLTLGGGYNFRGPRVATLLRAELGTGHAVPYLGLGFAFDFGFKITDASSESGTFTVKRTLSLLAAGGVSWVTEGGFTLNTTAGYGFALYQNTPAGVVNNLQAGPFSDIFPRSAPILGLGIGYSF